MNWADYLIIVLIALSMLIGLWRGLLREVISLTTWIAAFAIALLFAEDGAAHLTPYLVVHYTGLTGTDRVLGMAFGLARGAAVIAVLVLAAGLTPLPKDPWWQQALLLRHFQESAVWLRDFLPPELAQNIRFP